MMTDWRTTGIPNGIARACVWRGLAFVVAMVGGAELAGAQVNVANAGGRGMGMMSVEAMIEARDPVGFLIEHARDFALADDQVKALQGIRRETRAANRPLMDALEKVWVPGTNMGGGPGGGARRGDRPALDSVQGDTAVRSLLAQIHRNQDASRARAMDVLSDDQRAQFAEAEEQRALEMQGGRRGRPGGAGGPGGRGGRGGRPEADRWSAGAPPVPNE